MFAISYDNERFEGSYSTVEEAIKDAADNVHHEVFWVGRCVSPTQPEDYWCAEDWLEHVSLQDEYGGDYADGWEGSTTTQREELETEVRAAMAAWLDRHKLRPRFYTVVDVTEYTVVDGAPVKVDQ